MHRRLSWTAGATYTCALSLFSEHSLKRAAKLEPVMARSTTACACRRVTTCWTSRQANDLISRMGRRRRAWRGTSRQPRHEDELR